MTPARTVSDAHRRSWQANGFYRIDGFAPADVGGRTRGQLHDGTRPAGDL